MGLLALHAKQKPPPALLHVGRHQEGACLPGAGHATQARALDQRHSQHGTHDWAASALRNMPGKVSFLRLTPSTACRDARRALGVDAVTPCGSGWVVVRRATRARGARATGSTHRCSRARVGRRRADLVTGASSRAAPARTLTRTRTHTRVTAGSASAEGWSPAARARRLRGGRHSRRRGGAGRPALLTLQQAQRGRALGWAAKQWAAGGAGRGNHAKRATHRLATAGALQASGHGGALEGGRLRGAVGVPRKVDEDAAASGGGRAVKRWRLLRPRAPAAARHPRGCRTTRAAKGYPQSSSRNTAVATLFAFQRARSAGWAAVSFVVSPIATAGAPPRRRLGLPSPPLSGLGLEQALATRLARGSCVPRWSSRPPSWWNVRTRTSARQACATRQLAQRRHGGGPGAPVAVHRGPRARHASTCTAALAWRARSTAHPHSRGHAHIRIDPRTCVSCVRVHLQSRCWRVAMLSRVACACGKRLPPVRRALPLVSSPNARISRPSPHTAYAQRRSRSRPSAAPYVFGPAGSGCDGMAP